MSIMAPPQPASLYQFFDRYGVLIYVGITSRGPDRQQEHATKSWWPYVARQAVLHFDTREQAVSAEAAMIQERRPPFNRQHNPTHHLDRDAYQGLLALQPDADPLAVFRALPHRRLRLSQVENAPQLTFRTDLPSVALAQTLHLRPCRTRVREWHGPFQTGVLAVDHVGPLAILTCAKANYPLFRFAEAVVRWDTKTHAAWVQSIQVTR